jgi:tetratricopeptide (TPR) repeat protein
VTQPRRNEPCPCGSGKRYKDCHGRLEGAQPSLDTLIQRALSLHHAGQVDAAERDYREILERDPGNAIATHYMGLVAWQRGDLQLAERQMRAGIAGNATVPDFHNNLGLLLRDTRRLEEAIACFAKTLEVDPSWYQASNNLGLAYEAAGRWEDAIGAYREALAREPRFAAAQQNLARVLLARGEFAEGFRRYQWRLSAQGLTREAPDEAAGLPRSLQGEEFVLVSEQGLGDVLFFLRFAPIVIRRGARLAFRGDARLHSILARTGLFELGIAELAAPSTDAEMKRVALYVGELPWLLRMADPADFPPPLALAPQPERVARLRAVLEAQGPPPYIALTWRAGTEAKGPSRTQLKAIDLEVLGEALRGIRATWISVQRLPAARERERLAASMGALVRDFSATNDDLEEMLALMSIVDGYVGVSNANVYLRTGTGKPMQVLVPHPPEWRWMLEGARSPWFANVGIYRERADGDWGAAMRTLRERLTSRAGS